MSDDLSRCNSSPHDRYERQTGSSDAHPPRSGRPSPPPRQTSFSKRHASFDSPREVPFQANQSHFYQHHPNIDHPSSTLRSIPSRPTHTPGSPTLDPYHRRNELEHEWLSNWQASKNGSPPKAVVNPASPSTQTSISHSPGRTRDVATNTDALSDRDITTSASASSNLPLERRWDSAHLRPRLLTRASQTQPPQQEPGVEPASPISSNPAHVKTYEAGTIHMPTPHRPSSAESLPLPTQTPISTLPLLATSNSPLQMLEQTQSPPSTNSVSSDSPLERSTSGLTSESDSSRASTSSSSFPLPTPPVVHSPPPPPSLDYTGNSNEEHPTGEAALKRTKSAPYEPFLSHAPPHSDCFIAVETTDKEYRLIVRLPGYNRDSITLAMRRRRILHIVADSWEAGGGHFERRISFGYDADLALVRAEFDGEHLKVVVPRKPAMSWFGPAF